MGHGLTEYLDTTRAFSGQSSMKTNSAESFNKHLHYLPGSCRACVLCLTSFPVLLLVVCNACLLFLRGVPLTHTI